MATIAMASSQKKSETLMEVAEQRVILNISGQKHVTTISALLKYPTTKLGRLAQDLLARDAGKLHYYDADQDVFKEILRYYRHGELHKPPGLTGKIFIKELQFWGIEEKEVALCCRSTSTEKYDPAKEEQSAKVRMEKQFQWFEKRIEPENPIKLTIQEKIWYSVTEPSGPFTRYPRLSTCYFLSISFLIVLQSVCLGLVSVQSVRDHATASNVTYFEFFKNSEPCYHIELLSESSLDMTVITLNVIVFLYVLDNVFRFAFCPKKRHFFTVTNSLDVVACLIEFVATCSVVALRYPPWLVPTHYATCKTYVMINNIGYFVGQLRVFRLFVITTAFSSVRVIWLALYASLKEIGLLFVSLGIACLFFGPLIFYTEAVLGHLLGNDDVINIINIPQGYWWSVVTMTTVGYGDFYPTNVFSYISTTFIMGVGLMVTALPIAIIGGNFAIYHEFHDERQRKKQAEKMELEIKSDKAAKNTTVEILVRQTRRSINDIDN